MRWPYWHLKTDKRQEGQIKGFVIGATGSGTGKTTVTIAILSYLAEKGYKIAPFKVGPDFIDPGHHSKIAGKTSFNLDSWMLSKAYNTRLFSEKSQGADVAIVEGVMGLFDGYSGLSESGSTAQMAKWLNLPVVLIVSAKGKARSAAAIVKGFETFDAKLKIAGVIFSQTGSLRHYDYLKKAVEQSCKTPCLGCLPKNEKIIMPERHLGLVTADEFTLPEPTQRLLSEMVEENVDVKRLIENLEPFSIETETDKRETRHPQFRSPTIGVPRDKAFCFYYQDNLDLLKASGANILEFSPLKDKHLPDGIDGLYFGGGYPEVYAEKLSQKTDLLKEIKQHSKAGMPIYGECGGFMFLCESMTGLSNGKSHKMAGCFDFKVHMSKRLRSLGYREITLKQNTIIGKKGDVLRGHEFHYSSLENPELNMDNVYHVTSRAGQDLSLKGYQKGNTLGSYLHVHFGSNPSSSKYFVNACRAFKENNQTDVIQNT
jgi:cobyrinic acid a,c-diamide synthase